MTINYTPKGVCSRKINIELEDNIIKSVEIIGGCDGNLKGISKLLVGQDADTVIEKFSSITCGSRATSCPDQIARALKEAKSS